MTENNGTAQEAAVAQEPLHTAPILTLHPEAENKQVLEQAVELFSGAEAPAAPDARRSRAI